MAFAGEKSGRTGRFVWLADVDWACPDSLPQEIDLIFKG